MLKRLRQGMTTSADVDLINTRVVQPPASTSQTTYLAYTNADVGHANEAALRKMKSPICHFEATHQVTARSSSEAQKVGTETRLALLEEARQMTPNAAKYLPVELNLAIHAPVVLTFNLEQRLGLCNGSRGVVYDIIADDLTADHLPIVLVRMDSYTGPSFLHNVERIVPITCRSATLSDKAALTYRLSRTALPLRLGFATTIHKIQGQTCGVVVFNPANLKTSALAYVALSRVRSQFDMYVTIPIQLSQLRKPERTVAIDQAEDARVEIIVKSTETSTRGVVSHMKLLAEVYNQAVLLRAAQT